MELTAWKVLRQHQMHLRFTACKATSTFAQAAVNAIPVRARRYPLKDAKSREHCVAVRRDDVGTTPQ